MSTEGDMGTRPRRAPSGNGKAAAVEGAVDVAALDTEDEPAAAFMNPKVLLRPKLIKF